MKTLVLIVIFLFQLNNSEWIALSAIVVPVIGSIIFLIFKSGSMIESIKNIQKNIELIQKSTDDIQKLKYSFGQMNVKVDFIWRNNLSKSNSPIILNDVGKKILETSKISDFTQKYYNEILSRVKSKNPVNPYQAQEYLISVMSEYQNNEECKLMLQDAAFKSGYDVISVLYVGAIDIRDKIISDLGFVVGDIDKHDPNKK